MSTFTPYAYKPIEGPHSIRVLFLDPAIRKDFPLMISLQEIPLHDPEKTILFEALSYTWGAREGTLPIFCDGKTIFLTPNCESALRHLRLRFKRRTLWIDAICIDQSSIAEKNQQVPLMGEIYVSAIRTVIWLGEGEPGDAETLRHASVAARFFQLQTTPGFATLDDTQKGFIRSFISPDELRRIARICQGGWFQRIWTMQECLLPQKTVFMMGRSECDTSDLYTYFIIGESLLESDSYERRLFRMRGLMMGNMGEIRNSDRGLDPQAAKNKGSKWTRWSKGMLLNATQQNRGNGIPSFTHSEMAAFTLEVAAMSAATDAKDKAYGILAYVAQLGKATSLPVVDYSKSIAEVYEEFTLWMLRHIGAQWTLGHIACHAPCIEEEPDWPSWVLDLRETEWIANPYYWSFGGLTRAPLSTENDFVESVERGRLRLKARRMAQISEVCSRMPKASSANPSMAECEMIDLRMDCLSKWTAVATDLDSRAAHGYSAEKRPYITALEKLTTFLDYLRHGNFTRGMQPEPTKHMARWRLRAKHTVRFFATSIEQRQNEFLDTKERRFDDVYDGSTLFVTDQGPIGLCREEVRVGDFVFQAFGGVWPYILREVPDRTGEYWFVGISSIAALGYGKDFWYEDATNMETEEVILI